MGCMDIIPEKAPKDLTSETSVSDYLLFVDAYLNIPKFMVWIELPQKK